MTYKEKYWREHPELTVDQMDQIIKMECPDADIHPEYCDAEHSIAESCHKCWNREIPGSEIPAKMKVAVEAGAIVPRRASQAGERLTVITPGKSGLCCSIIAGSSSGSSRIRRSHSL